MKQWIAPLIMTVVVVTAITPIAAALAIAMLYNVQDNPIGWTVILVIGSVLTGLAMGPVAVKVLYWVDERVRRN